MKTNNSNFFEENELQKLSDEDVTKIAGGLDNQIPVKSSFSNYSPIALSYGFAPICMRKIKVDSEGNVERNKSIDTI